MPRKTTVGASTKRTTHLKTVQTKSGNVDKRYNSKQFTKNDGTRDMRTKLTKANKK